MCSGGQGGNGVGELSAHYLTGFSSLPPFLFLEFIILSTVIALRGFGGVSAVSWFWCFGVSLILLLPSFSDGREKFCPV